MNIQGFTPQMTAPVQAHAASSPKAVGGATNDSGNPSSLQDTFLNLLVTELQNQDPTSPVDPTAMVGQMVSLNQLDQLISINQTLTIMTGGTQPTSDQIQPSAAKAATSLTGGAVAVSNAPPSLSQQQLYAPGPSDPMNLYGTFGTSSNSISNPTHTGVR